MPDFARQEEREGGALRPGGKIGRMEGDGAEPPTNKKQPIKDQYRLLAENFILENKVPAQAYEV